MNLSVQFLGTSAARPTVERNVTSIAINHNGEIILFDCGEGTQRQMMKYGVGFKINHIFFSHVHADHILGLPGLLSTFGLQDRKEPLNLYVPRGGEGTIKKLLALDFLQYISYRINLIELAPYQTALETKNAFVYTFRVKHRDNNSLGYRYQEKNRPGTFYPEKARELKVPEGPAWGRLQKGLSVLLDDGTWVDPQQVKGADRSGRSVVYTGDTAPLASIAGDAEYTDLLIHDATFLHENKDRAVKTLHSTALEAGICARDARAGQLVMTHISSKYAPSDYEAFMDEARSEYKGSAIVAWDGLKLDIRFRD